jgi:hypothetical protein
LSENFNENQIEEMGGAFSTHGEIRNAYNISVGRRDHSEDLGVNGRKILESILKGGKFLA